MKKTLITLSILGCFAFQTQAQRLAESAVPVPVKTAFAARYPGLTAKWEKEDGLYEASFSKQGEKYSASFEPGGKYTEEEQAVSSNALPEKAQAYIKAHYAGKSIHEVAKITSADGTVTFEAEINGKDVIFSSAGDFIKEEKD